MSEIDKETLDTIIAMGSLPAKVVDVPNSNIPVVVIPEGFKVEGLEKFIWNEHRERPERIKQSVTVQDVDSFVNYYNLFSDENTRTFADENQSRVLAVLDYHGAKEGSPRWGSHRLTLLLQKSPEWVIWLGNNNKAKTQQEFCEFLEQHATDITKPSPAHMKDIAGDLWMKTDVEFSSSQRQTDGQVQFKYSESSKTGVGTGDLMVPESFTISIAPFFGGQRVDMIAMLRFRLKEGKLTFFYTLIRPDEVLHQAFLAARDTIATQLQVAIINGSPV